MPLRIVEVISWDVTKIAVVFLVFLVLFALFLRYIIDKEMLINPPGLCRFGLAFGNFLVG